MIYFNKLNDIITVFQSSFVRCYYRFHNLTYTFLYWRGELNINFSDFTKSPQISIAGFSYPWFNRHRSKSSCDSEIPSLLIESLNRDTVYRSKKPYIN